MDTELLIKAPEVLFHGSRRSSLSIKDLNIFEVMELEGEFRQIFGGSISLADDFEEAKRFAQNKSRWENLYKLKYEPTVFEFRVSQEKYFFDASMGIDLYSMREVLVPVIESIAKLIIDNFNQEIVASFELLLDILHDEKFSEIELTLMRLYSLSNMINIQVFSPLNRALCIVHDLAGVSGIVPSVPDENNKFSQIRDYSIFDTSVIDLVKIIKL